MKYQQVKSLRINRRIGIYVSNLTAEQKAKLQLDLFGIGVRWASGETKIFAPALEPHVEHYIIDEARLLRYSSGNVSIIKLNSKQALNELRYRIFLH